MMSIPRKIRRGRCHGTPRMILNDDNNETGVIALRTGKFDRKTLGFRVTYSNGKMRSEPL